METRDAHRETFEKLTTGMSYEEVVKQLGSEGKLVSEHTAQIEPGFIVGSITTDLFEWRFPDGELMRILFSNNELLEKFASF